MGPLAKAALPGSFTVPLAVLLCSPGLLTTGKTLHSCDPALTCLAGDLGHISGCSRRWHRQKFTSTACQGP